jgi:drug/metabolite transporter (DMT)-like permease
MSSAEGEEKLFLRRMSSNLTGELSGGKVVEDAALEQSIVPEEKARPVKEVSAPRVSLADGLVFLCICIWAVNVPCVKLLLGNLMPLEISLTRYTIGSVFFIGLVLLREKTLRVQWRHLPLLILAGVVGITLNQVFFVYALENTTSSEVSLLMASTPSFATIFAWLSMQEKIKSNFWLSLPLALAGVALIVLTAPGAHLGGNLLGDGLALATSASWAAYTVAIRPLLKHYSIARISAYVLVIGVITMLPFGWSQVSVSHFAGLAPHLWLTLAYCTFGALVLTNFLWYGGVKHLGAPRTAFYAYLQPFFGVIAAFFILSEVLVPWQILGGILVVFSMIIYRSNLHKSLYNKLYRAKS